MMTEEFEIAKKCAEVLSGLNPNQVVPVFAYLNAKVVEQLVLNGVDEETALGTLNQYTRIAYEALKSSKLEKS